MKIQQRISLSGYRYKFTAETGLKGFISVAKTCKDVALGASNNR
jgi:hypothetical protein